MTAKFFMKVSWLRFIRFLLYIVRWLVSIVIVALLAILLVSPVILSYLSVLDEMGRTNQLFGGSLVLLWLAGSALLFIPMLVSVLVSTIKNGKKLKQEQKNTETK